jgi:hypothetical protein
VAIRIAASDEEMRCSPNPISGKGMTISAVANSTSQRGGNPRRAPVLQATGSSSAAARATRDQATKPGVRPSSTAILMNR